MNSDEFFGIVARRATDSAPRMELTQICRQQNLSRRCITSRGGLHLTSQSDMIGFEGIGSSRVECDPIMPCVADVARTPGTPSEIDSPANGLLALCLYWIYEESVESYV